MYFTLAVSAPDPGTCAAMTLRACRADPRVLPIPGPAQVAWRSADGRAALVTWGPAPGPDTAGGAGRLGGAGGLAAVDSGGPGPGPGSGSGSGLGGAGTPGGPPGVAAARSHAGTIWASDEDGGAVLARTGITRVDPVYLARAEGTTLVSDRATWAAAAAGRLTGADPLLYAGLLGPGYPLGAVTPFAGVRALSPGTSCRVSGGTFTERERTGLSEPGPGGAAGATRVAEALVRAVTPLRDQAEPVELSLTGGKDSRIIAAALTSAGVPVRARTYGFPGHPDVEVARLVARELGLEHTVAEPRTAGSSGSGEADGPDAATDTVQEVDVLGRLRATVLVSDGMLSAFENVGRPDPHAPPQVMLGGHGGELLRGGYAKIIPGSAARRAAASGELLRRLAMRRVSLLRARWRTSYLASLAPWVAAVASHPQPALDEFYLVNRAGRWSAAARQAYSIRSVMVQPFFDDQVVRAARAVPLAERLDDRMVRGVLAALCPPLLDIPLAADRWKCEPAEPAVAGAGGSTGLTAPAVGGGGGLPGTAAASRRAGFDWRRGYGDEVAAFLRDYVLDVGSTGGLFAVVSRPAAERLLKPPHSDPVTVWALATLAALISEDWLSARAPAERTFAIPVPA